MGNVLSGMQNNFNSSGGFEGLLSNPAFQAGIGILEANNAAPGQSTNAISGALRGAQRAGQFKDSASERKAFEEQQELQKKLREQLQQIYGSQAAQNPATQLPQQPQGAQLHSPFGQQQAPMQSPLPGQPPTQGTPPGFTQAPGTNAAPGANDIAALMLQYGTPQQQQSAFQSLSAGERFKTQLAQAEDQFTRRNDLQRELSTARGQNQPSNIREWEYYNSLGEDQKKEYLNLRRGGNEPSSTTEKRLYDYNDAAFNSRGNVEKYNRLANNLIKVDPASGVIGKWTERAKAITGNEDEVTLLRKQWVELRNSAAIQQLPPGVASDKDIELVMSGFLPDTANAETIASFMRGLAKTENIKADYNEFAAEYVSSNPARGGVGLDRAWRQYRDSGFQKEQTQPSQTQGTTNSGISWSVQ